MMMCRTVYNDYPSTFNWGKQGKKLDFILKYIKVYNKS